MRVVHVSPHLPPDQSANALLPAQLGRWVAARRDEVAFVAHEPRQRHARDDDSPVLKDDLATRWIPRRTSSAFTRALKLDAWQLVRRVNRALNDVASSATILHLHSNGLIIEAAASWARRRRVPYVLTLYGTEIWHYKKRWPVDPFTRGYMSAAGVTFYSRGLLDHARGLALGRDEMSVVYPPVPEEFTPQPDASRAELRSALGVKERFLILNVKRLHPLAGQQFLIDAFAQLCASRPGRDARLVICGEGPRRQILERQIQSLGLADRVTMTGLVPNATIARYMAAADVFVLPSILEALPTVAVEALASGTPVISADHPGGVELQALFGGDVTVVPRESAPLLARALEAFLTQPRRALPATARTLETLFRPPAVLRAFDLVYAAALREPR
jgi:glycosyltransferase involved in cell wall biosynthesis